MNISADYKTPWLLKLYNAIKEALDVDDRLSENQKIYGVRAFPDWRRFANDLEKELDGRGTKYTKIKW